MRVLSLVPSWTETLIEAGIEVCGRTRFCIHPQREVSAIPVVGGTKKVDWEIIMKIKPDLVLLDKEENPKDFAQDCPFPWQATHVLDLQSSQKEMKNLAELFSNKKLFGWADELGGLLERPKNLPWNFNKIPGEILRIQDRKKIFESLLYVIWKNPWMAVRHDTYIGSVLQYFGAPLADLGGPSRYPEVSDVELTKHYLLFSSEPFPFHKKKNELISARLSGSIVDGEKYGWFGIRSLNFLKETR
jgi:hypothetical protein